MTFSLPRRALIVLAGLAAVLLAGLGLATAAGAEDAPYGPPTPPRTPGIALSAQTPCAGGTMSASGFDFAPGEAVTLVVNSDAIEVGTFTAGADGSFSASVTLPADFAGNHSLTATGPVSGSTSTTFTVSGVCEDTPATTVVDSPKAQGGAGLAYTGVPAYAIAGVAVLLLVGGVTLVLVGRRRGQQS